MFENDILTYLRVLNRRGKIMHRPEKISAGKVFFSSLYNRERERFRDFNCNCQLDYDIWFTDILSIDVISRDLVSYKFVENECIIMVWASSQAENLNRSFMTFNRDQILKVIELEQFFCSKFCVQPKHFQLFPTIFSHRFMFICIMKDYHHS